MNPKFKILQIIFLILFLCTAVLIAPKVTFDDSLRNWVPRNDPIVDDYQSFLQDFKTDALIIVSIVDSSRSSTANFQSFVIDSVMKRIRQLPHVHTVMRWPPPFLKYKIKPKQNIRSFFVTYIPPSHWNPNRPELIQAIQDILQAAGLTYHMAGTGVIHKAMNEETRRATNRFLLIGLSALFTFLFFLTRSLRIVLQTIGISLGGVAVIVIAAYLLKIQINMIMSVLPILVLFYSSSISIHILNHRGHFKVVFWPTVIAVLTTCAGFSTLLFEPAPLLRSFGMLAIAGLLGGFFWAVVMFLPGQEYARAEFPYREKVSGIKKYWTTAYLVVGAILLLLFTIPSLRVRAEINPNSLLPANNSVIRDYHFIENNVSPYIPIEYRVNLTKFKRDEFQKWVNSVFELEKVGAVMNYLNIPFWLNPQKLGYISRDGRTGRVTFFVPVMSTTAGLELVKKIERISKNIFSDGSALSPPTGFVALYVSVADNVAKSFAESLLLAFLFVFLIIFVFLKSLKLFLAVIFPNLLPVAAVLGVMGFFHIPLDMVTLPIGCLALGIIVDDTIHFLYWYRKSNDLDRALHEAGPGMVVTSVIHILGFAVFLLAAQPPIRYFGMLSITAMVTALFGDIILLPVLVNKICGATHSFTGRKTPLVPTTGRNRKL